MDLLKCCTHHLHSRWEGGKGGGGTEALSTCSLMTSNHKAGHTLCQTGTDIHGPAPLFAATFILVSSCIDMAASTIAGCGTPVEEVEFEAAESGV